MPLQLAWCQHFHYKLCFSGLDFSCKRFCPRLKTCTKSERAGCVFMQARLHFWMGFFFCGVLGLVFFGFFFFHEKDY